MKKAYLFWYKSSEDCPTTYIYIIAYTRKQACFYFYTRGFKNMYDYESYPIDEVELKLNDYAVGTVLGDNAIL